MSSHAPGQRRSSREVRGLILASAEQLFTDQGVDQTTMRAIAAQAGISPSVLHHHFPTKGQLFSAVLVEPFLSAFATFGATWQAPVDGEPPRAAAFVRELHRNLSQHRHAMVRLLAASEQPDAALVDDVRDALGRAWRDLRIVPEDLQLPAYGGGGDATRDVTMLVIAAVAGIVAFGPWVAAARDGEDEHGLVELAIALAADALDPSE